MMTIRPYEVVDYDPLEASITALRERLAQPEHDWGAAYTKQVELHNQTLDELRDALAQPECNHEDRIAMLTCVKCGALVGTPPVQKPVAWMFEDDEDNGHKTFRQTPPSPEAAAYLAKWNRPAWVPLDTAPQPREWQGLTDEELREAYLAVSGNEWCLGGMSNAESFYEAIEAKLKEKNT